MLDIIFVLNSEKQEHEKKQPKTCGKKPLIKIYKHKVTNIYS